MPPGRRTRETWARAVAAPDAWPLVPDQEVPEMTVHALGEDREHCVCGELFPDAGWLAQLRAEVEPWARLGVLETYADAPRVTERLRAALTKEMG